MNGAANDAHPAVDTLRRIHSGDSASIRRHNPDSGGQGVRSAAGSSTVGSVVDGRRGRKLRTRRQGDAMPSWILKRTQSGSSKTDDVCVAGARVNKTAKTFALCFAKVKVRGQNFF